MADLIDSDAGTERFTSYEAELKLVLADLTQQLDTLPDLTAEPRKAALSRAERALEEATELLGQLQLEKANVPAPQKSKANTRFRNLQSDVDAAKRRFTSANSDRRALFGSRYTDDPEAGGADAQLEQRQQLLSGTDRLGRSSQRLRESQRIALETEEIGAGTLGDLQRQREQIVHSRGVLLESEGYADRSIKTLRSMARRYV